MNWSGMKKSSRRRWTNFKHLKADGNVRYGEYWLTASADNPTVIAAARLPVLCGFRRFLMVSRAALAQLTWLPIRRIKSHRFVISAPYHFRLVDC